MLACFQVRPWGVMAVSTLALLFATGGVRAQDCYRQDCQDCYHCQRTHCPPCYKHCQEGAPRIKFQCGCPQPICNPCNSPNWGYFQTCWMQYPWQNRLLALRRAYPGRPGKHRAADGGEHDPAPQASTTAGKHRSHLSPPKPG